MVYAALACTRWIFADKLCHHRQRGTREWWTRTPKRPTPQPKEPHWSYCVSVGTTVAAMHLRNQLAEQLDHANSAYA